MRSEILFQLTTTSTIAEVPAHGFAAPTDGKARLVADLFHDHPALPGVLLTDGGRVVSAISRRYYHEMVGSYCGMDLYLSRPVRLMMDRFEKLGGALILAPGTPIREAVERALSRPRDLIYEPLIVLSPGGGEVAREARLVDFEDLLIADSRLSSLRNLQMSQILGTVGEGLLLIQPNRKIAAEYSRSAETLLETREIGGRTLDEVLAGRLDADRCRLTAEFVDILFRPNVIEKLVRSLNPLARVELVLPGSPRRRIVSCRFARQLEAGRVNHLLLRLEDITQSEEQARELAAQEEVTELKLSLAVGLAEAEPSLLVPFLSTLDGLRQRAEALIGTGGPVAAAKLATLAREFHAAKGEAGLLALAPIRLCLHELEDQLSQVAARGAITAAFRAALERLDLLSREAQVLIGRFRRFGARREGESVRPAEPLSLFARLGQRVRELAAELGKEARFICRVNADELPAGHLEWLGEVLAQLVNNALVHGIEPPVERQRRGKPPVGTLQFATRPQPGKALLEFVFQDDGAGLDPSRLRAKAEELGLAPASDRELAQLIFRPGFTTASRATLDAGRGVGLDSVRARIAGLGGRVAVHSEPGRFCAIRMLLPVAVAEAA